MALTLDHVPVATNVFPDCNNHLLDVLAQVCSIETALNNKRWRHETHLFNMKNFSTTALTLICVVLVISIFTMKHGDDAQRQKDTDVITGFSNQLDSAQTDLAVANGRLLALTNSLGQSQSASLAFSNQLIQAQSTAALDAEQMTKLNRQLGESQRENQNLDSRIRDMTNRLAGLVQQTNDLTGKLAVAKTNMNRAIHDYALLEDRLRQDVAERLVVERKFNNLPELQAQAEKLRENPAGEISAQSIYADLDVEVTSNSFHVISPN